MFCKKCGYELSSEQIFCPVCGTEAGKGNGHCAVCGNKVDFGAPFCQNCGSPCAPEAGFPSVKKRDLVAAILLSIFTCGIYAIYWFICLTNDMNRITGNEKDTSGGVALLLTLITCGIYGFYWAYKLGEKRDSLDEANNYSGVLYLVLSLLGLEIVVYALAQAAINDTMDRRN